jgi:hypothetical protein
MTSPSTSQEFQSPNINRELRRSTRVRFHNTRLRDFIALAKTDEPKRYSEACINPEWVKAMKQEYQAIMDNKTWVLTELPPGANLLETKWIYKAKKGASGKVEKLKARLVVKGYMQIAGEDYDETFAPVVRWCTIHVIVAIAKQKSWKIYHMDVKAAFLNGDLKETVYIAQPEGFIITGKEHLVCLLQKALYGLKQSPRTWWETIGEKLASLGLTRSEYNYNLFYSRNSIGIVLVIIYVDDILVTSNNDDRVNSVRRNLSQEYCMTDLGKLAYYIGVEYAEHSDGIILTQRTYIGKMLRELGMANAKPVNRVVIPGIRMPFGRRTG